MTATQGSTIPADAPMLEVSGIHSFYGQAHILFDVSLNVRAGEVVVLLGRNGAGKSTTLKSIAGLVRPREAFPLSLTCLRLISLSSSLSCSVILCIVLICLFDLLLAFALACVIELVSTFKPRLVLYLVSYIFKAFEIV